MNKAFIKKMIKAEKYKYEALKDILPVELKERLEGLEKEAFTLVKDIALEMLMEDGMQETEKKSEKDIKKKVKKVDIDFSN
ncbi:hypothetical protein [Alkaliphilus transvaalensis]|uniref:hypothetical protein n=1 Tax=Alkaliphilus transvaalensis TaxID=114628 RepID=UPI0004795DF8|nr:hypothetical protein [Alkaliphilus transvaalensis]